MGWWAGQDCGKQYSCKHLDCLTSNNSDSESFRVFRTLSNHVGPPPDPGGENETAARGGSRSGGDRLEKVLGGGQNQDRAASPSRASAIIAQVGAIAAYGVEHPEVRLRLRCALRDALVELEEARVISAERFLAARRGGA